MPSRLYTVGRRRKVKEKRKIYSCRGKKKIGAKWHNDDHKLSLDEEETSIIKFLLTLISRLTSLGLFCLRRRTIKWLTKFAPFCCLLISDFSNWLFRNVSSKLKYKHPFLWFLASFDHKNPQNPHNNYKLLINGIEFLREKIFSVANDTQNGNFSLWFFNLLCWTKA